MTVGNFRVQQIDHVEVFVPDRYEAAEWYKKVLGLEVLPAHQDWAVEGGPLMISSDGGHTMIALFTGKPQGGEEVIGIRRIAFRVDADGFLAFLKRLDNTAVYNQRGNLVMPSDVSDHGKAFSIYFCDPYGNPYEITTYDYEEVAKHR